MYTYFLAMAILTNLGGAKPDLVAAYKSKSACEVNAIKANHQRTAAQIKEGVAAICLKFDGPDA